MVFAGAEAVDGQAVGGAKEVQGGGVSGGDSVPMTPFAEVLPLFEQDDDTDAVVIIAGRTAPDGKKMGHAGAITAGNKGTVAAKVEALEAVRARVADHPATLDLYSAKQ